MDCKIPIKAVSPNIKREQLYTFEKVNEYQRWLIQSNNEDFIQQLIFIFLDYRSEDFEILIKVHSGKYNNDNEIIWKYYTGYSKNIKIKDCIIKYHKSVFHDGNYQFLFKRNEDEEYICFDDHGMLFFYVNNFEYIEKYLSEYEKKENRTQFIINDGHWHYRFKEADKLLKQLIKELGLKKG